MMLDLTDLILINKIVENMQQFEIQDFSSFYLFIW